MQTAASLTLQPLDLRRVYIFPTRHGFLLGALLIIILLGAINYDNALAYLLCFLLGGLVLVAMLHTYRNLAGLVVSGARADPVFAGEDAAFALTIAGFPAYARFNLEFTLLAVRDRPWWKFAPGQARGVIGACASEATFVLTIPAPRRGRLALRRLRIRSTFPLGILQAWAYFETDAVCTVYPAPHGHLSLPRAAMDGIGEVGHHRGTDDFADLAPYRPGDPLRSIHWATLARRDEVLIKRFTGSGSGEVLLQWQGLPNNLDLEAKLSQLTHWVLEAERTGLRYGMTLPTVAFPLARGVAHCAELLHALALFESV